MPWACSALLLMTLCCGPRQDPTHPERMAPWHLVVNPVLCFPACRFRRTCHCTPVHPEFSIIYGSPHITPKPRSYSFPSFSIERASLSFPIPTLLWFHQFPTFILITFLTATWQVSQGRRLPGASLTRGRSFVPLSLCAKLLVLCRPLWLWPGRLLLPPALSCALSSLCNSSPGDLILALWLPSVCCKRAVQTLVQLSLWSSRSMEPTTECLLFHVVLVSQGLRNEFLQAGWLKTSEMAR